MDLASDIDHVLVHRRGATITRHAAIEAPAAGSLTLPGLPLALVDRSVRVSVVGIEGEGEVRITAVQVTLHAKPRSEVEVEPDAARLKAAQRDRMRQQHRRSVIALELGLVGSIRMPPRPVGEAGKAPPASPMEARVALDGFVHEGTVARQAELLDLDRRIVRLDEEIAALQDALRRRDAAMRARPDEVTKAVRAALEVRGTPRSARLALQYNVPAARWVPVYQVHVDAAGTQVAVTLRAAVAQASGEPWNGVRLSLSTAEPQAFTEIPKLASVRIGKVQPPAPAPLAYRPPPVGGQGLFSDYDRSRRQLEGQRPPDRPVAPLPSHAPLPPLPSPPQQGRKGEGGLPVRTSSDTFDDGALIDNLSAEAAYEASEVGMDREEVTLGRALAAPAPPAVARMAQPAAAAPAPRGGRSRKKAKKQRSVDVGDAGEITGALVLGGGGAPEPRLPSFATLRLPGPEATDRGRLRPVDPAAAYRSGLDRPIGFDPLQHVHRAERAAQRVQSLSLPFAATGVATDRFDHAYRGVERVDVPSEAEWHTVPVRTDTGPCSMRYVVVPREDPSVFRVASFPNPMRTLVAPWTGGDLRGRRVPAHGTARRGGAGPDRRAGHGGRARGAVRPQHPVRGAAQRRGGGGDDRAEPHRRGVPAQRPGPRRPGRGPRADPPARPRR